MSIIRQKYLLFLLSLVLTNVVSAQGNIEDWLVGSVENINPVYKPVVGLGIGSFNFLGDVKNPNFVVFNNSFGYKLNVSTFLDNKHFIRTNFYIMTGSLTGNERSYTDTRRNLNFKSDVLMFGINFNYDFDNFYKNPRNIHPFISVGAEILTFDSKTDLSNSTDTYHYWNDGSIRNIPQGINDAAAQPIDRDYIYETGLRSQFNWGLGDYPQYALAVPVDVGLDIWLSDRVLFRVGTSYHLVFSDVVDHVSYKNDPNLGIVGDKRNDDFMYSYFSLHLDLFSSDKEIQWSKMFLGIEDYDYSIFFGDEDGDGIYDGSDKCLETPYSVPVDTAGCPLDDDLDGVPNYRDDEPSSRYGAMVDDRGVEMSAEDVILRIDQSEAVDRKDVSKYVRTPSSYANYKKNSGVKIPDKYKEIDEDKDGYISFDEMMNAIDGFFDFDSELGSDDIHELNKFFFSQ